MKIVIWSKPNCIYCFMAKELFIDKGWEYTEIIVTNDNKEELARLAPSYKTVPQIFVDNRLIGGYTDFLSYYKESIGD